MRLALAALITLPVLAQETREAVLGWLVASEFRRESQPFQDQQVRQYVENLGKRLTVGLPAVYTFEVVHTARIIEPAVLPGGHVFVPVGAFALVRNEAEFAGLLAHTIAHEELRHGLPADKTLATVPVIFFGDVRMAHAAPSSQQMLPRSWWERQRKLELDADAFGLKLLSQAGFDPAGLRHYVARVQSDDTRHSPFPDKPLRLEAMDAFLQSSTSPNPAGDDADFEQVKHRASAHIPRAAPSLRR